MKIGFSLFYCIDYVEWHTGMTRKSEAVTESWGVLRFVADEFHVINTCEQNSMRDTLYKVEVLSTLYTVLELVL